MKEGYDTMSQAMNGLKEAGYKQELEIKEGKIHCDSKSVDAKPEDFIIEKIYRFEGNTDPADESAVYAVSSSKHNIKGVLVSAFGTYANRSEAEVLKKMPIKEDH